MKINPSYKIILTTLLMLQLNSCGPGLRNPDPKDVPANLTTTILNTYQSLVNSTMLRTIGSSSITLEQEHAAGSSLPSGYRESPIAGDTEAASTPVTPASVIGLAVCGRNDAIDSKSVVDSIADCKAKNPTTANWDGRILGRSGEGLWNLVFKKISTESGARHVSVWQDAQTGLLWSDYLFDSTSGGTSIFNWCAASGSVANFGGGADCTGNSDNLCVGSSTEFQEEKAYFTATQVQWRLPTLSDLKRADVNGIRYGMAWTTGLYWTSTVSNAALASAWALNISASTAGFTYATAARAGTALVRCVGRVVPSAN